MTYTEKKLTKLSVFVKYFPYEDGRLLVVYNPSFEYVKGELMFEKNEDKQKRIKYAGFSLIYTDTDYDDKEVERAYYFPYTHLLPRFCNSSSSELQSEKIEYEWF